MLENSAKFYIHGEWVSPAKPNGLSRDRPHHRWKPCAVISLGDQADTATRGSLPPPKAALPDGWRPLRLKRTRFWKKLLEVYQARAEICAKAMSTANWVRRWIWPAPRKGRCRAPYIPFCGNCHQSRERVQIRTNRLWRSSCANRDPVKSSAKAVWHGPVRPDSRQWNCAVI